MVAVKRAYIVNDKCYAVELERYENTVEMMENKKKRKQIKDLTVRERSIKRKITEKANEERKGKKS